MFTKFFSITLGFVLLGTAGAYETDQYSFLDMNLKDASVELNNIVNQGLKAATSGYVGPRDEEKLGEQIALLFSSRQLERWVNSSGNIETASDKKISIFNTTTFMASPIIRVKGLSHTINLCGVHTGSDKMSHFFGVGGILGHIYNKNLKKGRDSAEAEKHALNFSIFTEKTLWGELTTNIYSNADLVANYEGYLFLRGLFEDGIGPHQTALIRWEGDRPVLTREFNFCDYVSNYWSEAVNESYIQGHLARQVKKQLAYMCLNGYVARHKDKLFPADRAELEQRYQKLGLKRKGHLTLENVCRTVSAWPEEEKTKFLLQQKELNARYAPSNDLPSMRNNDSQQTIEELAESASALCKRKFKKAMSEHQAISQFYQTEIAPWLPELNMEGLNVLNAKQKGRLYQDHLARTCSEMPIPGQAADSFTLCLSADSQKVEDTFYHFKRKKMERFSLESLHGILDEKAYVYRTIPMLCRWY